MKENSSSSFVFNQSIKRDKKAETSTLSFIWRFCCWLIWKSFFRFRLRIYIEHSSASFDYQPDEALYALFSLLNAMKSLSSLFGIFSLIEIRDAVAKWAFIISLYAKFTEYELFFQKFLNYNLINKFIIV